MTDLSPFDFIFVAPENINSEQLMQGDLLRRTPDLLSAIEEAHSYYADAKDYAFFLVLTQSCDLVRRQGKCKSRYITICAVRPLSVAVGRELDKLTSRIDGFPFRIGELERGILARQYLDRTLNNTVDGLFFIPKGSAPAIDEHYCAFLPLSIALRVDHYDACLAAKVAQTEEIFAAKVGSLASGLYSRIATPDLHEKHDAATVQNYKDAFFDELGLARVAWLSPEEKKALKVRIANAIAEVDGQPLAEDVAVTLLQDLPNETVALADRVLEILTKRKLISNDEALLKKAKSFLLNDPRFKKLSRK